MWDQFKKIKTYVFYVKNWKEKKYFYAFETWSNLVVIFRNSCTSSDPVLFKSIRIQGECSGFATFGSHTSQINKLNNPFTVNTWTVDMENLEQLSH